MKSIIKRRAKSALAILLTLCMVFSVFTVSIASVGAATDDSESVGANFVVGSRIYLYSVGHSWWNNSPANNTQSIKFGDGSWSDMTKEKDGIFYKDVPSGTSTNKVSFGRGSNGQHNSFENTSYSGGEYNTYNYNDLSWGYMTYDTSDDHTVTVYYDNTLTQWNNVYFRIGRAKNITTDSNYNSAYKMTKVSGTENVYSYTLTAGQWDTYNAFNFANAAGYTDSNSIYQTLGNKGDYSATDATEYKKFALTESNYYFIGQTTTTTVSGDTSSGCTYHKLYGLSGGSSQYDGSDYTTYQKTVSVANNANAEVSVAYTTGSGGTITEGNSATVLSGSTITVTATTSGIYTLDDITVTNANNSASATIASSGGSTFVSGSAESVVTANVSINDEPLFCLVGNVNDETILDENGDVITPDAPTGSASYWNTWQDDLVIDGVTGTPGVYRKTIKINENGRRDTANIGLYLKGSGQKAFILNGTAYNTSGSDLTITDAGIADGDNLYVNELGSPAGGSIVLKKGQTYTIIIDQTKRYNDSSSYPWGKITITTTDAFVDAFAKMQSFNATTGRYEAITDATATVGTASASPVHGSKTTGFESILTAATVNNNYTFQGWYSDAACTQSVSTDATHSLTNVTESAQYYALFKQNTPSSHTVTTDTSEFGNISITGGVDNGSAYQGATVSIKATVTNNSKEFSHWSILTDTANPVDITSTVCANPTQAQTTLTMPGQNIRIVAFFAARTPLNITVSSNNDNLGTASYDDGKTYYVGDTVEVEATNAGGVFSRWVVTGGTIDNATSATAHITSNGATVTARAVFDYKTYNLYYNSKLHPMIRQSDGTYVSTMKVHTGGEFTVYNASDSKYAYSQTSGVYELHSGWTSGDIYSWTTSSSNYKYQIKSSDTSYYYVKYTPASSGNGSVSIVSSYPTGDIAQIYAKDGTVRYASGTASSGDLWSEGGEVTAKKGTTTVTKINTTAVSNPDSTKYPSTTPTKTENLRIYSAPIGSTITIETQVGTTYTEQGFYVGMYVINGWKVPVTDMGSGKFTATYTLSDDYEVVDTSSNKSFEITPVYYNKNFEYVTFYVDAKSVPSKWKGTISTCADYRSTDGKSAGSSHFEGSYPGQPLGREGDLYEIKVAKYYYDNYNSTTGKWSEHTNYYPSATITAYNYDVVHHYYYVQANDNLDSADTNTNYQTYDYADFSYLAQIKDIEAIMFRCKETTNNNRDHMSHWNYDFDDDGPSFELLTDYYGRPIDALGNVLKDDQGNVLDASALSESDAHVKILSVGNENTTSTDNRTKAQWSTKWIAYNLDETNKKAVTMVSTPADYIDTNINTPGAAANRHITFNMNDGTSSGQDISALQNKVTYISYDKERANVGSLSGDGGNTGIRIDGQWYYSALQDFDSTVQVHITTDEGTAVTKANTNVDADSSEAGTNDGWEGTDSNCVATLDGKTTETYSNVTTEAALSCTLGSGYTFVGWYIYDGTTYTKIHDNFVDQNTTMTMKKNYTIVAVVRAVAAGDLVITHSRYTGPGANDGTGKYYVSAVVNKGQANEKTIPEALNSITVQNLQSTDKLTITIRTVCNGADTFYAWYEEALGDNYSRTGNYYEICSEDVDPIGEKEVSYTFFEADCSTFFKNGTLARNTIDLYSDITHVSAYAKLTYKYYDRFAQNGKGQMVSYVVKDVPLSDTEIDNGYIPSDEKIAQYAPKVVDTIYTDTKWSIVGTKVERAASNVTLMATQTAKTCYVQYLPNNVVGQYLLQSTTEEKAVRDETAWNTRIVDFNTWLINDNANLDAPDESDFYVSAPTTYTYEGTTWNFDRFDIYEFDRLTGYIGNVIYSTNDNVFGYRIYADCVIYPVYTKDSVTKELTAKIEPAVLNREVYGDSTSPVDRLYADLIISFINIAAETGGAVPEVIKENNTEYTIETGVILDKSVNLTDTDYNTIKHAAETGQIDTTSSIISGYTGFTDKNDVKSFAQTAVADSTTRKVTIGNLTKYVNINSDLTNKNRLDKVFRYTNSTDAQKRIFAAYSYVLIKKNGTEIAFAISDVQKFNFCYTGNKPLSTLS